MDKKVALITGASQGIGREIAINMAKDGYDIVINYIGEKTNAEEVSNECKKHGVETLCIETDVTDYDAVGKMFEEAVKAFGRIDVLVNNSGITKDTLLLRMSEEDFDSVINVNLKGTFNCTKHVARTMMKQRKGSIINMASVIGVIGNVGQANYAASKAGIIGLTKSTARELAPRGIRANAVAPGFIATKMTEVLDDKVKENILSNVPLNDFGTMQDVADMVSFLASDKSRYVTGQVLHVDGGMVM